ncbi:hypothetical protein KVR01_004482 [Diaporthe batatas]|uniref:uncharacterized protein n=1 Tax=Diaporthe batatas TaxID=748121 RepID=UPI001D04E543|nr:uncharacterized protein KVR01_004482 [Diaporthe batatas]KAG8165930.1 hypothetical protein KVR01_004482 [Diaporthe batatas]
MAGTSEQDKNQCFAGETILDCYSWSLFNPFLHRGDGATEAARKEVVDALAKDLGQDFSFSQLCRSNMAIDTLWSWGAFQLTWPWLHMSDEYPLGKPMLTPKQMAKHGAVSWDGVKPATLQERVNQVSSEEPDNRGTVCIFFGSPRMMQVDLNPGEGCGHSLNNLFHFTATRWELEQDEARPERGWMRRRGEQAYVLIAAVKKRQGPGGSDSIRLFAGDGEETLPPTPTGIRPPDWGFSPSEPVPVGCRLSLFYETTDSTTPSAEIHVRRDGPIGLPREFHLHLLDLFEKQAEHDRLHPEAMFQEPVEATVGATTHVEGGEAGGDLDQDMDDVEEIVSAEEMVKAEEMDDVEEGEVRDVEAHEVEAHEIDVDEGKDSNADESEVSDVKKDHDSEVEGHENTSGDTASESVKSESGTGVPYSLTASMTEFFRNPHQQAPGVPGTDASRSTGDRRGRGRDQTPSQPGEPAGESRQGAPSLADEMTAFFRQSQPRQSHFRQSQSQQGSRGSHAGHDGNAEGREESTRTAPPPTGPREFPDSLWAPPISRGGRYGRRRGRSQRQGRGRGGGR